MPVGFHFASGHRSPGAFEGVLHVSGRGVLARLELLRPMIPKGQGRATRRRAVRHPENLRAPRGATGAGTRRWNASAEFHRSQHQLSSAIHPRFRVGAPCRRMVIPGLFQPAQGRRHAPFRFPPRSRLLPCDRSPTGRIGARLHQPHVLDTPAWDVLAGINAIGRSKLARDLSSPGPCGGGFRVRISASRLLHRAPADSSGF